MPGGSEWIIIIIGILVLFGGKKIPEFMRGLGKGVREFKDAKDNVRNEFEKGIQEKEVDQKKVILSYPVASHITVALDSYSIRKYWNRKRSCT